MSCRDMWEIAWGFIPTRALSLIPPHKSLFRVGPHRGLPIGNLTSQFFANVYLNEFDQFVKQTLKCRFYIRYVDDAVLVDPVPDRLLWWRDRIAGFLEDRLSLALKDPGRLRRVSDGADFLGYIVRPDYLLVRRRVVNNLKYKLAMARDELVREIRFGRLRVRCLSLPPDRIQALRRVVCSYISHFQHANAHRLIRSIFDHHDWLGRIFEWRGGKLHDRLKPRRGYRYFRTQVRFFKSRLPGCVCFIRMGRYVELYDEDAKLMNAILGFQLRRNVRGMRYAAGFKAYKAPIFNKILLRAGYNTAFIEEAGPGRFIRERYVRTIYLVPIHKWLICPISALRSKFYPRNIRHMPAVKFFARLDLDQIFRFLDGHYLRAGYLEPPEDPQTVDAGNHNVIQPP